MSISSSPLGGARAQVAPGGAQVEARLEGVQVECHAGSLPAVARRGKRPTPRAGGGSPQTRCRLSVAAGSVAEEGEHGEDAAVVVFGVAEMQLLEDGLGVAFDGSRAEVELSRDGSVRAAFGDERQHGALAVGEVVEDRAAAPGDEAVDDAGVERGASGGDALDGGDELGDVADAVLEQVADA